MSYKTKYSLGGKMGWIVSLIGWLILAYIGYQNFSNIFGDEATLTEEIVKAFFLGLVITLAYFGATSSLLSPFKIYIRTNDLKILKETDFLKVSSYIEEQLSKSSIYTAKVSLSELNNKELSYTVRLTIRNDCTEQYNMKEIEKELSATIEKWVVEQTGCRPSSLKVTFKEPDYIGWKIG